MKKISLTIILILSISIFCFSQRNYQQGYIITNNNDTISGYLRDRKMPPFGKLYNKVRVKQHRGDIFYKTYGPYRISAYSIGQAEYQSMWLSINFKLFYTDYNCIPNVGEKIFFRVVIQDYLSYYQTEQQDPESDNIDIIDFFKRADQEFFVRVNRGIFGLQRNILAKYFMDCPVLATMILTKEINKPIEIANYYNNWIRENK